MPRPKTRRKTASRRIWTHSSSDDLDFDMNFQLGVRLALSMSTRSRRKPKKKTSPRSALPTAPKRGKNTRVSIISLDDSASSSNSPQKKAQDPRALIVSLDDSDDECNTFIQSKSNNDIRQNVQGKVDNFFKSSGLISDDEDLPVVISSNNSNTQNPLPIIDLNEPCCSTSSDPNPTNNGKEKVIVIEDDSTQINSLAEIENYCKETEDLLKNANALLEKFAGTSKVESPCSNSESTECVENSNQEKGLGECPVCYESLAQNQVTSTKCGHLFCRACIEKIAVSVKKCPTCRKAVNKKNIIPIYI